MPRREISKINKLILSLKYYGASGIKKLTKKIFD